MRIIYTVQHNSSFFIFHSSFFIFLLLHNYCQKTYCFAIERFHAMWKFRVKINTVSLIEDDFFAFDVDKHTSFDDKVELLSVMLVIMDWFVVCFRFNGDDERIGGTVHES